MEMALLRLVAAGGSRFLIDAYLAQSTSNDWAGMLQRELYYRQARGGQRLEMGRTGLAPSAFERPVERRLPTRQDASRARAAAGDWVLAACKTLATHRRRGSGLCSRSASAVRVSLVLGAIRAPHSLPRPQTGAVAHARPKQHPHLKNNKFAAEPCPSSRTSRTRPRTCPSTA